MSKKNQPVNDGWKTADPDFPDLFAFVEEGDQVAGVLVDLKSVTTDFGEGMIATLTDPESGADVAFFLSTALRRLLTHKLLGSLVRVEYLGFRRNEKTGRDYKAFQVQYREGPQESLPLDGAPAVDDEIPF